VYNSNTGTSRPGPIVSPPVSVPPIPIPPPGRAKSKKGKSELGTIHIYPSPIITRKTKDWRIVPIVQYRNRSGLMQSCKGTIGQTLQSKTAKDMRTPGPTCGSIAVFTFFLLPRLIRQEQAYRQGFFLFFFFGRLGKVPGASLAK